MISQFSSLLSLNCWVNRWFGFCFLISLFLYFWFSFHSSHHFYSIRCAIVGERIVFFFLRETNIGIEMGKTIKWRKKCGHKRNKNGLKKIEGPITTCVSCSFNLILRSHYSRPGYSGEKKKYGCVCVWTND